MKTPAVVDIRRHAPQSREEALSRFLSLRKSQGAAERTLEGYKVNIPIFFKRFPAAWSSTCRECLREHLAQDNISTATFNNRLKSLCPFFEFTARDGSFSESPAAEFKYRRGEESVSSVIP